MASPKPLPSLEYLRSRLRLDATNGRLYWLPVPEVRPHDAAWNQRFAGQEAGADKGRGYRVVRLDGTLLLAHRVVAALATGGDPYPLQIDHAQGVLVGDQPAQLRRATNAENVRNRTFLNRNNTSGVAGVYWHKGAGKWAAGIKVNGQKKHLGLFDSIEAAAAARRAAELEFFGAFAPQRGTE